MITYAIQLGVTGALGLFVGIVFAVALYEFEDWLIRHTIVILAGSAGIGGACAILHPSQPGSMLLTVFFCLLWLASMDIVLKAGGK